MRKTLIAAAFTALALLAACGQEEAPTAVQPGVTTSESGTQTPPGAATEAAGNKAPENTTDDSTTQKQLTPTPNTNKPGDTD